MLCLTLSYKSDIIKFSETWLSSEITQFFTNALPRYKLFSECCKGIGGGIAAYINENLNVSVQQITCGTSFEHLELLIKTANNINILLFIICRPPYTSSTNFINDFSQYLDEMESFNNNKKLHYIFAEDYINLMHYEKSIINQFITNVYTHAMYLSIPLLTRIKSHSVTLIDNIFTNSPSALAGVLVYDLSDYLPILLILT